VEAVSTVTDFVEAIERVSKMTGHTAASMRLIRAQAAYFGAIAGVISTDLTGETEHATSDWQTDARDTLWTMRDLAGVS
jgi:hypothetical protein